MTEPTARDATAAELAGLGRAEFVRLTTFRRSGAAVGTPVWVVGEDDDPATLWVITPAGSGKVKRLRHTAAVTLVACDRRGRVAEGAVELGASAQVRDDAASLARLEAMLVRKHPVGYRLITALGTIAGVLRRRSVAPGESVGLRITARDA